MRARLRSAVSTALTLALVASASPSSRAQEEGATADYEWVGSESLAWSDPDNWIGTDPECAPGCSVLISCPSPPTDVSVLIDAADSDANCGALITIDSIVTTENAVLNLVTPMTLANESTFHGDTLAMSGGPLTAGDTVNLLGTTSWTNGDIDGSGTVFNSDTLDISGPQRSLSTNLVNESGKTVTQTADLVLVTASGVVDNFGIWTLNGDGGSTEIDTVVDGYFSNAESGTLSKTGSAQTDSVLAPLDNLGGTIGVTSGTFRVTGGGQHSGDGLYAATDDARLELFGDTTLEGDKTIQLTGNYNANGAGGNVVLKTGYFHLKPGGSLTADFPDTSSTGFELDMGQNRAFVTDGVFTNEGKMTWTSGIVDGASDWTNASGTLTITGTGNLRTLDNTLVNQATVRQLSDLVIGANGNLETQPGGTHDLIAGDLLGLLGGKVSLGGSLRKPDDPATEDSTILPTFDRSLGGSQMLVEKAKLFLSGGGTWGIGETNVSQGAELHLQNQWTIAAASDHTILGDGITRLDTSGGTITVEAVAELNISEQSVFILGKITGADVRIGGDGRIVNEGGFRWASGSIGITDSAPSADFINRGTLIVDVTSTTLSGTIENENFIRQERDLRFKNGTLIHKGSGPGAAYFIDDASLIDQGGDNRVVAEGAEIRLKLSLSAIQQVTVPLVLTDSGSFRLSENFFSKTAAGILQVRGGIRVPDQGRVIFTALDEVSLSIQVSTQPIDLRSSGASKLTLEGVGSVSVSGAGADILLDSESTLESQVRLLVLDGISVVGAGQVKILSSSNLGSNEVTVDGGASILQQAARESCDSGERLWIGGRVNVLDGQIQIDPPARGQWGSVSEMALADGSRFTNLGCLRIDIAAGTRSVTGEGIFSNSGILIVEGNAGLEISSEIAQLSDETLTGGTWVLEPGSTLSIPAVREIADDARVVGSSTSIPSFKPTVNEGSITANGSVESPPNESLDNSLLGELQAIVPISRGTAGATPGGYITQQLNNAGRIFPGTDGTVGTFHLTGDLQQLPTGRIRVDIGGSPGGNHDEVEVVGAATLAGTLQANLIDGFEPQPSDSYTVLTTTEGITGSFDNNEVVLPTGGTMNIVYETNAVLLNGYQAGTDQIFADGFESGGTGSWSDTEPPQQFRRRQSRPTTLLPSGRGGQSPTLRD